MMKDNRDVLMDEYEFEMDKEELYKIEEYNARGNHRIYIRKFGEPRGFNLYFANAEELKRAIIGLTIENKKLKKKLKSAKLALR